MVKMLERMATGEEQGQSTSNTNRSYPLSLSVQDRDFHLPACPISRVLLSNAGRTKLDNIKNFRDQALVASPEQKVFFADSF